MPTEELISKAETEDIVAIEQLGRFSIFKFPSELMSYEIIEMMQKEKAEACNKDDLNVFNQSFPWEKGTLVALAGKFYGGWMNTCYTPALQKGRVYLLNNIYGDRGTWDTAFYFLAKEKSKPS